MKPDNVSKSRKPNEIRRDLFRYMRDKDSFDRKAMFEEIQITHKEEVIAYGFIRDLVFYEYIQGDGKRYYKL